MCGQERECRQTTNAPTAIFKSHFTLLRVKRPDTALCEKKSREPETGGGGWGREMGRK